MSRKDPRRALFVPLSGAALAHLRRAARGRSLADALRRIAEEHAGPVPEDAAPRRYLPVQLPRRLRARLADRARAENRSTGDLLAGMVAAAQIAAEPSGS